MEDKKMDEYEKCPPTVLITDRKAEVKINDKPKLDKAALDALKANKEKAVQSNETIKK